MSNEKLQTAISGIFHRKKFFSKIGFGHVMSIANTHLCAKNWKKLMIKSRENAKKPVFTAYFRHFRPEKIFFRKLGSVTLHFRHCHFASLCQKSAKNNEPISRKVGDRRTDGRTDNG